MVPATLQGVRQARLCTSGASSSWASGFAELGCCAVRLIQDLADGCSFAERQALVPLPPVSCASCISCSPSLRSIGAIRYAAHRLIVPLAPAIYDLGGRSQNPTSAPLA